jgi:hypothetical protein
MNTPYASAQAETVWRIALWIKDLETTNANHVCTGPTTGECLVCSADDMIQQQHKAIQRVRDLHSECKNCECNDCRLCDEPFPCETIKALDGATA